jgi:DNA-directed RNA polymerase specialized sigma24 family protein
MSRDSIALSETIAERDRRLDALLASMCVEEGLDVLKGRPPRQYSLEQIADFCGVGPATVMRIEERALKKLSEKCGKVM